MIAIDPLPEEQAREVVYQIVDGVQHLHSLNIVHLDLKVSKELCPVEESYDKPDSEKVVRGLNRSDIGGSEG